ncbi:MAG: hypothetical protein AB1704_20475 [Pseudomonadota bacterium]
MNNERNEISLHDVLKQRVEAGEPIYINGPSNPAVEAEIDRLANEAGKPVRVVQTLELRDATPDELAVLKNAVEQGRHTQGSIAKAYIKSADSTGEVLAVIQMQDGPHADSHQDGDDTRHTLQVAFSHVFGREVSVVFETDIPTSSDPGLVFIP